LKPNYAEAHNNLGATLKELGRLEEAEASYRQVITLNPDFAGAHNNLGIMLKELGRLDEAEASYTQAIALKPDYAEAHHNLGIMLQELGRLDEAEASYNRAIALKPDFAKAYDHLGDLLQNLGEFRGAEVCYKKCISLAPSDITITKSMASALFAKGEFQESLILFDSYNTPYSRSDALKSLYALGNTEEIYKRIEETVELDEGNLGVAAFATFIAESQNKHTAHSFCRKPLEFLHFSNLSYKIEHSNLFITNLIEDLKNVQSKWQPPNQSANGGFQTVGNLFKYPNLNILTLKEIILNEIDLYYKKFQNEDCAFIKKWPAEKNITGWHIMLKEQGYHNFHIHQSGWLSGVIYLKVVPSLDKNEGAITFSVAGSNISNSNLPEIIHSPAVGDIVLFPSSLYHGTIPFSTDTDRIVVSFDLKPRKAVINT
jgi:Tfp pilus assembly protein PilF